MVTNPAIPTAEFERAVRDFLSHIFGSEYRYAWVTGFAHDPAATSPNGKVQALAWSGGEYRKRWTSLGPTHNNYLCISTFREGADGKTRRQAALHGATYALMIDDVTEKVDPERVKLAPTFKIQTSPKSQQWWYVLREPESNGAHVKAVIDNLIAAGLMTGNKDPGMRGVNRYGRLPFGCNTKPAYRLADGSYPTVHLAAPADWSKTYSLQEFATAFEIDTTAPTVAAVERPPLPEEALAFNTTLLQALQAEGLYKEDRGNGKHEITCPWVHEHTNAADNGAAVFEAGYIDPATGEVYSLGGFRCHHGHGEDVKLRDVVRLLHGRGYELAMPRPAPTDPSLEFTAPLDDELLELGTGADATLPLATTPPVIIGDYECTDTANAHRLATIAGGRLRWHMDLGQWMYFNAGVWELDNTGENMNDLCAAVGTYIVTLAAKARTNGMDEASKLLTRWAITSRSKPRIDAMEGLLRSKRHHPIYSSQLDNMPHLLGTANGIVDLRSAELLTPDLHNLVLMNTRVGYQPEAEAPDWEPFLRAVTAYADGTPDPELYAYIRLMLGYCLTGLRSIEMFVILYGSGANGKSTLLNTLQIVFGNYARRLPPEAFELQKWGKSASAATPELARLPGARLVLTAETAEGARLNMPLIKQMTGDTLMARHLYRGPFEFTPQFKLLIATNHLPVITGTDAGTWRRIMPIPFERVWRLPGEPASSIRVPLADVGLGVRLELQREGVLRWLIAAARDYLAGDGSFGAVPRRVAAARNKYQTESDIIGNWIADRCDVDSTKEGVGLYASYRRWCEESGMFPMSAVKWGASMRERFGEPRKSEGMTIYRGLTLKEFK